MSNCELCNELLTSSDRYCPFCSHPNSAYRSLVPRKPLPAGLRYRGPVLHVPATIVLCALAVSVLMSAFRDSPYNWSVFLAAVAGNLYWVTQYKGWLGVGPNQKAVGILFAVSVLLHVVLWLVFAYGWQSLLWPLLLAPALLYPITEHKMRCAKATLMHSAWVGYSNRVFFQWVAYTLVCVVITVLVFAPAPEHVAPAYTNREGNRVTADITAGFSPVICGKEECSDGEVTQFLNTVRNIMDSDRQSSQAGGYNPNNTAHHAARFGMVVAFAGATKEDLGKLLKFESTVQLDIASLGFESVRRLAKIKNLALPIVDKAWMNVNVLAPLRNGFPIWKATYSF